ncbi:hypothetical protein [Haloplanus salilacus]|uniref:hypothetical protein n=1 Tax=Haloplanus salilacus TaxID=2949994 RepID=UPI0030CCC4EF
MSDHRSADADGVDRCGVVYVHVEVRDGESDTQTAVIAAPEGSTLRDVLRDAGYSPYTRVTAVAARKPTPSGVGGSA